MDEEEPKRRKRPRSKYCYTFGDLYPGVIIGHKTCNPFRGASTVPCIGTKFGEGWVYKSVIPRWGKTAAGGAVGAGGQGGSGGYEGPGGQGGPGSTGEQRVHLPPKFAIAPVHPRVPAHMGWLWTAEIPGIKKKKRGWSPGAIGKSVAKLMTFKCPRGGQEKDKRKKKGKKKSKHGLDVTEGDSEGEEQIELKPTLKIHRKGNVFTIEVNPLKDLTTIEPNEDPYVNCDPMVFKIIKKRSPEEKAKMEARKMIKIKLQRDEEIRKNLTEAVEDICKCAYMDIYCNDLTALDKVINKCPAFQERECICEDESQSSLSSGASWDIEYTPPFGCIDPAIAKRQNYIHVETQYTAADAGIPETVPPCCKSPNASSAGKKRCSSPCRKS